MWLEGSEERKKKRKVRLSMMERPGGGRNKMWQYEVKDMGKEEKRKENE